jgi:methoxymalonate biosynthesis protein
MDGGTMTHPKVKCLVWDLDDTLWRGTLAEGDDVTIPPQIREVIRGLDSRGILNSIASRNAHEPAMRRLAELDVAEYFVLPRIGWGRKPESVKAIVEQLRFSLDTIAFIDDQPNERAEMAFHLPSVRCYPAEAAAGLLGRPEFSPDVVTPDAARRRRMYQEGFARDAAREAYAGPDEEFLRSLDLELRITPAGERDLHRVEELTLRTSQMNATGVHYSEQALRRLSADAGHDVLVTTLTDRFGPHGAVGVVVCERHPATWHLKLLATSCRVVSLGAGSMLLRWLVDAAAQAGVHLVADFRRTSRNRIMEVAYRFAGFSDAACECRDRLDEPSAGVQRLHLVPTPQRPPDTVRIISGPLPGVRRATSE